MVLTIRAVDSEAVMVQHRSDTGRPAGFGERAAALGPGMASPVLRRGAFNQSP